jgi:hypothetical protein
MCFIILSSSEFGISVFHGATKLKYDHFRLFSPQQIKLTYIIGTRNRPLEFFPHQRDGAFFMESPRRLLDLTFWRIPVGTT